MSGAYPFSNLERTFWIHWSIFDEHRCRAACEVPDTSKIVAKHPFVSIGVLPQVVSGMMISSWQPNRLTDMTPMASCSCSWSTRNGERPLVADEKPAYSMRNLPWGTSPGTSRDSEDNGPVLAYREKQLSQHSLLAQLDGQIRHVEGSSWRFAETLRNKCTLLA